MPRPPADASQLDIQPLGLLLVDDEPAVLQSLQRLLRSSDFRILTAANGTQALAHLEQTRVDVVVSDIGMPGMSGTELFAQIAARWPDTCRIALTGTADIADAVAAINTGGIFRWVPKPWDSEELRRTVQEAAERARRIQTTRRRFQAGAKPGAQAVPHSIKRFFKGEVIFKAGSPGHHTHFIRTGKVELSVEQDGRRIVLDTCNAGDCFGAVASVLADDRAVTATAVEFTETFSVTAGTIEDLLKHNDPLLGSMVKSMAVQTRRTLAGLGLRNPVVNAIESAAHALDLMAKAAAKDGPQPRGLGESQASAAPSVVKLPQREVIQTLSAVTGMVKTGAQSVLTQMAQLNLVALDGSRQVQVRPGEIVTMARNLAANYGDTLLAGLRAEAELIGLEELSDLVGASPSLLHHKIGQGELPDTLWAFRRSETLRVIQEKGQDFFRKRTLKRVEDFDEIADILFIDRDSLGLALSEMEVFQVATLLKDQNAELKERALGSMSTRLKTIVTDTMEAIHDSDDVEVGLLEAELIDRLKAIKASKGIGAAEQPTAQD